MQIVNHLIAMRHPARATRVRRVLQAVGLALPMLFLASCTTIVPTRASFADVAAFNTWACTAASDSWRVMLILGLVLALVAAGWYLVSVFGQNVPLLQGVAGNAQQSLPQLLKGGLAVIILPAVVLAFFTQAASSATGVDFGTCLNGI